VIGDTNSTLGCALAAAKLRIPVVHVEAGLRSEDAMLAEEINRRMVDATSAVLCAPSERIAERLRTERLPGRIEVTGDIARDVLVRNLSRAPAPGTVRAVDGSRGFAFATLHRAELTSDAAALTRVIGALGRLDMPVLLPLHPRTRKVVENSGLDRRLPESVQITAPLGYLESLSCTRDAAAVVTDSGGVQREAYWLGTPCVTVRTETEWAETVSAGANVVLPPAEVDRLPAVVREQIARGRNWDRDLLGDGRAADRITRVTAALVATAQTQGQR
jgi:UDP-N-acetylglucosamine 2-epimerase